MYVRCKITDATGTIPATGSVIAYVNNILPSLFSSCEVFANETLISDPQYYGYRAMVETILNNNAEMAATLHAAQGFILDSNPGSLDATGNDSYSKRATYARMKEIELAGKIYADIFSVPTLMLPGINFKIRFKRASNDFAIINPYKDPPANADGTIPAGGVDKDKTYSIHLLEATLFVRRYQMLASLSLRNHQLLQKGALIKYPIRRVQVRSFYVPNGTTTFNNNTLLSGILPERIVLMLVANESVGGKLDTNPYNFEDFYLDQLEITSSNQMCKFPLIGMNFKSGAEKVLKPYFFSMLGVTSAQTLDGFPMHLSTFKKKGNSLFVFDLRDASGAQTSQPLRSGSINISMKFRKSLEKAISVIIYSEYSASITVDKLLQVELRDPTETDDFSPE